MIYYTTCRQQHRKWVVHVGPTNSGKTYHALRSVAASDSGVYCGPLRLLAWEVHEKLTRSSTPCDLITGQERVLVPHAKHRSSTIEMVKVD